MPVERVRITPTSMQLQNAAGNIVFDTANRYLRRVTPGELNITTLTPTPFPVNTGNTIGLPGTGGDPKNAGMAIFRGQIIYRTLNSEVTLPKVSSSGVLSFLGYFAILVQTAGGVRFRQNFPLLQFTDDTPLITIFKNGTIAGRLYTLEVQSGAQSSLVTATSFYYGGYVAPNGFVFPFGQPPSAAYVCATPLIIPVTPADTVVFRFTNRITHLGLQPRPPTTELRDYIVTYYSDTNTLPLSYTL